MLEPTATAMARSTLSLQATVTAVACSAAFPTLDGTQVSANHPGRGKHACFVCINKETVNG